MRRLAKPVTGFSRSQGSNPCLSAIFLFRVRLFSLLKKDSCIPVDGDLKGPSGSRRLLSEQEASESEVTAGRNEGGKPE